MTEKKQSITNKNEWKELKTSIDELINYLDYNNSIFESVPQLKTRYDKELQSYSTAVENKDYEMLTTVKNKLIEIYKDFEKISIFHEWSKKRNYIDKEVANELIEKGNNAIINNNIKELEDIIKKLLQLKRLSPPEYECILDDSF